MQKKVTARVEVEFYPSEYDSDFFTNLNNLDDVDLTTKSKEMIEKMLEENLDTGMWTHLEEIIVTTTN
jgi:ribosomal protein S17E